MSKNKQLNILDDVHLDEIIKTSIKGLVPDRLDETYVAQEKQFKQVSELVSQKTKTAHIELYKDYISTLNNVSARVTSSDATKSNSRSSDFRSLRLDETYNLNAVYLHELYFANCFDPHSEITMDSKSYIRLERDYGTFDDWQKDFIACALAAGNGWAVCGFNSFLKRYVNTIISNNSQDVMIGFYPIIVLDMHEHAYVKDYLTDKKSYIVAQMTEFNWGVIEERFVKADAIAEVLK